MVQSAKRAAVCAGSLTGLPVKATVRQDVCNLWVFSVVKDLCGEDSGLVDENTERDVPHL